MTTTLDVELVGELFGLPARLPATLTAVARGAVGRIWRLELGADRYAVKELFTEPDVEAAEREAAFTSHLAAAGVPLPASVPAADGRIVVATPAGGWLRLYQWVDGTKVDLADEDLPPRIGGLLASLHANAPPTSYGVHPWYESTPDPADWPRLADEALTLGAEWAPPFAALVTRIPELAELVTPMATDRLVMCHCDLHPENVLVTGDGELVPLDWECFGPADPDRELAKMLLDWLVEDRAADPRSVAQLAAAYRAAGRPGLLPDERAFGMAIAADLNFLHLQVTKALDPGTPDEHLRHATMEIAESVGRLPTRELLAELVDLAR